MRDQRAEALAQILVRYSTKVTKGDVCVIQGTTTAEPLVQAVYEEVLRAGGLPIMQLTTEEAAAAFYRAGLRRSSSTGCRPRPSGPPRRPTCGSSLMADANSRALSQADPKKQARSQKARKGLMDTSMKRSAAGEYRWALTLFPTHAYAGEAGMSLAEYEDFYYAACLATDDDPVTAWQRQSDEVNRLAEWMEGKEEVHIKGPGHRHRAGRGGAHLDPVHRRTTTCPTASSSPGRSRTRWRARSRFSFPATYGGREVAGVRFRFEGGKVVDATAERGEDFLIEMLDTDDGARRLGELGIGTNYGIATGTKEILLDEKIGGTVHMAIGDELSRDRRRERLRRALGHGLRPAPGRLDHGRRHGAAARRQVRGLTASGRVAESRERPYTGTFSIRLFRESAASGRLSSLD